MISLRRFARHIFARRIAVATIAFAAAGTAFASEHHGTVQFAGLPLPGASIVASQNEKRLGTLSGFDGKYSFPDLADGVWHLRVEMLCFATAEQDVTVASNGETPVF